MPFATAILTVLYPDELTVYDVNVCQQLQLMVGENYVYVGNTSAFETRWQGNQLYRRAVERVVAGNLSLRDKDRFLIGKSFAEKLRQGIETRFDGNQVS